jgi:hypothetical protein
MQARFAGGRAVFAGVAMVMAALLGAARATYAAAPTSSMSLPPGVVSASVNAGQRAEPHPEIRAAIRSLEAAREHLRVAAHDFGGHRVEALAAIDNALAQLRLALQYDR